MPQSKRESRSDSDHAPRPDGISGERAVPILDNRDGPSARSMAGKNRPVLSESARSQQTTAGGRRCTLSRAKKTPLCLHHLRQQDRYRDANPPC